MTTETTSMVIVTGDGSSNVLNYNVIRQQEFSVHGVNGILFTLKSDDDVKNDKTIDVVFRLDEIDKRHGVTKVGSIMFVVTELLYDSRKKRLATCNGGRFVKHMTRGSKDSWEGIDVVIDERFPRNIQCIVSKKRKYTALYGPVYQNFPVYIFTNFAVIVNHKTKEIHMYEKGAFGIINPSPNNKTRR